MELRQYRHVLALADHASFRKASEALGISQPALTKSLFQIEREVGQRLFDRHGQTISPTVFGAIVVDTARKMLDSQESMAGHRPDCRPGCRRAVRRRGALHRRHLDGEGFRPVARAISPVTHRDPRRAVGESPGPASPGAC